MSKISKKDKEMIQTLAKSWLNRDTRRMKLECPPPESIAAYAFGELDPEDERIVEAHVINCPKCLTEVVDLRDIKASTTPALKKAPSRLFDLAKLADQTRRDIANKIYEKLRSIYPGHTELALSYVGLRGREEKEVIRLPKQIWHTTATIGKQVSIIDKHNEGRSLELQPLADALQNISFYYFIIGIGKDNKLRMISADMDPAGERHLPIEVDASHIDDTDILWVVIDSDKETIMNIYTQLTREISKKRMTIPKIEPFAWVIVLIE